MNKNKHKHQNHMTCKVAMILYTQGLEYDDRIRKEILTLQEGISGLKFTIFAIVPENIEQTGLTDYGVPFYIPYLKSRKKYKSGKKTLIKALEFYRIIKPKLKEFDVVWCADIETFLFPLFLPKSTKLIWDHHELPSIFINNKLLRVVFKYMEKKTRLMYHANLPRIQYLLNKGIITDKQKHIALRNFSEGIDKDQPLPDEKYANFLKWLGGEQCVYIQGINAPARKSYETLKAILSQDQLKAVIIGNVDKASIECIIKEYGDAHVNKNLYFTGYIPQKNTKLYIKKSVVSLVFYDMNDPNNIYCEPNRMFQSIMNGIPVIVGKNPSMRDIVEKYNFGIVLDDDGSNVELITTSLKKIMANLAYYKANIFKYRDKICWSTQNQLLIDSFKKAIL